jgi:hypothetical protein
MHVTNSALGVQGNAHMTEDGPVCQHGPLECQMNRKLSCFIHFHSDQSEIARYAACSEMFPAADFNQTANACIVEMGFDLSEVQECENGAISSVLLKNNCGAFPVLFTLLSLASVTLEAAHKLWKGLAGQHRA